MTTPITEPEGGTDSRSPELSQEELVTDIERTREELGETVDALVGKLDVKARARSQVDATRRRLTQQLASARSLGSRATSRVDFGTVDPRHAKRGLPVAALTVVALVGVAGLVWWRRR